jgi:spore maturation protein CgeB
MKVLLVAPMMGGSKGEYIARALTGLSHDVVTFDDWNLGEKAYTPFANLKRVILSRYRPFKGTFIGRMNAGLVSLAKKVRPDLILVIRGDNLHVETLEKIRRIVKAPLINWFPDSLLNPKIGDILRTVSCYDIFFINDSYSMDLLWKLGFRHVRFLAQCCDPQVHRIVELTDKERLFFGSDVSYVGSMNPVRVALLERLIDYDLKIWVDRRWVDASSRSALKGHLVYYRAFGRDQTRVFNASRVNLNPIQPAAVRSVNLRTFEIAGSGGFQIAEERDEIGNYFEPEKEIVTYRHVDELREKVDYYLAHERQRSEIARRAQRRAHGEHTYAHRLTELLGHAKKV